ncbi:MAG: AsmA-like C-terminal region-containing protein [Deltaproteobacteria bacterium]|nr:AsmA-like C-terminal region-containing protein [Deltaproteobacteria bacterium]
MPSKKLKLVARIAILFVLFIVSLAVLANYLIQRPSVQKAFLKKISDLSGFDIKANRLGLDFRHGVGIVADQLEAISRKKEAKIRASRVRIVLRPSQIIRGRFEPTRIYVTSPDLDLAIGRKGVFPKGGGALRSGLLALFWYPGLRVFSVQEGRVKVKELPYLLDRLNISIRSRGEQSGWLLLNSIGEISHRSEKALFRLRSSIVLEPEKHSFSLKEALLDLEDFPIRWVQWPKSLEPIKGNLKATIKVRGSKRGALRAEGEIKTNALRFQILSSSRKKTISLPFMALSFQSLLGAGEISVPSMTLQAPGLFLSGCLSLDLRENRNPHLSFNARSNFMELSIFKKYSPTIFFPEWLEKRLFPLLKSGEVRMEELSLQGSLRQLQNLGSAENQGLFAVKFECRNFGIGGPGIKEPFKKVSASVSWEKGVFRISDLKAGFGSSLIKDGGLEVKDISAEKPTFNAALNGAFEIGDLLDQAKSKLMPLALRTRIKAAWNISGHLDCKAGFSYKKGWKLPLITQGAFNFLNLSINEKKLLLPLILRNIEVQIRQGISPSFRGSGAWGNTTFKASGSFTATRSGFSFKKAEISASLDANQIMSSFYPRLPWSFGARTPCLVSVTRENTKWYLRGKIGLDSLALKAPYFSIKPTGKENSVSFEAALVPHEELKVEKALLAFNKSFLEISGRYSFRSPKKSTVVLSAPRVDIKDIGLGFSKGILLKRGIIKGHLEAGFYGGRLQRFEGVAEGKDLGFALMPISSPVRDCNFSLKFSDKKISIKSLKMRIGRSIARISGELERKETLSGRILVSFPFFDERDFSLQKSSVPENQKSSRMQALAGMLNQADIFVELGILTGEWKKLAFGPVKVDANIKKGDIFIQKSKIRVDRCLLNITGHIKSKPEREIAFLGDVKVSGQPIERLFQGFEIQDKYLTGNLLMEALVYSKGKDRGELLSALAGAANVELTHGVIRKSNVLIRILDLLSLQKLFRKAPPDITTQGFLFDSIKGHITIENGVLRTEKMVMKSPVFNAVGTGKLDLVHGMVDLDLGIHPLGTVDALVSKVPLVGYILTGEGKSLLTYYFEVKGPMKNPDVQYIPFKNLGKGVAGVLKRLFLYPVRIFDDIGKVIKNIPAQEAPMTQENR